MKYIVKIIVITYLIFVSGSKEFKLPDIAIIFFIEKGPWFLKKKILFTLSLIL